MAEPAMAAVTMVRVGRCHGLRCTIP